MAEQGLRLPAPPAASAACRTTTGRPTEANSS
jgi:hypothetical protein